MSATTSNPDPFDALRAHGQAIRGEADRVQRLEDYRSRLFLALRACDSLLSAWRTEREVMNPPPKESPPLPSAEAHG